MKLVVAARDIERIVRLQRDEDGAAAALVDEIEAVIEELAEQREPGVERGRQAFVRRDVGEMDVVAIQLDAVTGSTAASADSASGFERRLRPHDAAAACTAAACSACMPGSAGVARQPHAAAAAAWAFGIATRLEFGVRAGLIGS